MILIGFIEIFVRSCVTYVRSFVHLSQWLGSTEIKEFSKRIFQTERERERKRDPFQRSRMVVEENRGKRNLMLVRSNHVVG